MAQVLTDEQNIAFMNDPRVIEAQKQLDKALKCIHKSIEFEGNVEYYLITMPRKLQNLSDAYENYNVVNATVEAEILGKIQG